MNAAEALAAVIRARYDLCGRPDRYPMEDSLAEYLLEHLPAKGIAVVELPEPSYVDDPEDNGQKGYGFNGPGGVLKPDHGVYAYDGRVFDQYDGWTPEQARTIASWWLAAADAAERAS